MTKTFIENIKIIAKTDELLKKIPNVKPEVDKASIGSKRGVAFADDDVFEPCKLMYTSTDGVFTFAQLVDDAPGTPRIQDGTYNQCSQVNTITEMRETATDPALRMILKPDGFFLIADPENPSEPDPEAPPFDPDTPWEDTDNYTTGTLRYYRSLAAATGAPMDTDTYGGWIYYLDGGIPYYMDWIPLGETFEGGDETAYAYPNYNIGTIPVGYPSLSPISDTVHFEQGVQYQYTWSSLGGLPFAPGAVFAARRTDGLPPLPPPTDEYFQLAIDPKTRLWKPNPDETTAPSKYVNGVSTITMDFGADYSRKGVVRPAKDGGFLIYETSSGVPIGKVHVYRQDRTLSTIVPVSLLEVYLA